MNSAVQLVRSTIARADVRRRTREADARLWRLAPWLAALNLGVAAVSRWVGWPIAVPLVVLAVTLLAIATFLFASNRARPISDSTACRIDQDAGLRGELRSASWFAAAEARDDWAELHLERAASHLAAIDWPALYPFIRRPKAWTATALLMLGALSLIITLPARVALHASGQTTYVPGLRKVAVPEGEQLPSELAKQLEALLANLDAERMNANEMNAQAAELKSLLDRLGVFNDPEKLKDLEKSLAESAANPADETQKMLDMAKNAERAANVAALPPDVRDALKNLALQFMEDAQQGEPPAGAQPAPKELQKQTSAEPTKGSASDLNQANIQFSRDQSPEAGAGIVMLAQQNGDQGTGVQSGPGGGTGERKTGDGKLLAIEQALRRETVEASKDVAGDNVSVETRRKTEHGQAGAAFTHMTPVQSDKGGAAAPPPVPEDRRSQVQSYFIRKQ
jgi:hypothetical protein